MYYLETNALRSLNPLLGELEFKTSHLALIELLTGITNEREFDLRRKCLANAIKAKVIDQHLVETKIFSAFGIDSPNTESLFEGTVQLIQHVQKCQLADLNEHNYLQILVQYDRTAEIEWRTEMEKRIQDRRTEYSHQENLNEFKTRWNDKSKYDAYMIPYINYYANSVRKVTLDKRSTEQIASRYNGGINTFFIAMGYYVDRKVLTNNLPAKNDYFDMCHLLYLEADDMIVSNDNLIHDVIGLTSDKAKAIRIDQLKQNLTKNMDRD